MKTEGRALTSRYLMSAVRADMAWVRATWAEGGGGAGGISWACIRGARRRTQGSCSSSLHLEQSVEVLDNILW